MVQEDVSGPSEQGDLDHWPSVATAANVGIDAGFEF